MYKIQKNLSFFKYCYVRVHNLLLLHGHFSFELIISPKVQDNVLDMEF